MVSPVKFWPGQDKLEQNFSYVFFQLFQASTCVLNKSWEELITYSPFTAIQVFDTSRKEVLVCTSNEVDKTIQLERLQCWYDRLEGLKWHDVPVHTKLHDDQFRHASNIKAIATIQEAAVCS
jgi:hypothetical protein